MNNEGFIKLHRSLLDWGWHTDSKVLSLFVHLLMMANYEDRDWLGISVKRGQLATSLSKLSEVTGESVQNIRTCLRKLESTGELTSKTTSKYRIITICNYDKYQIAEQPSQQANQQTTNKQLTSNQQQLKKERNKEDIVVVNNAHARDYLLSLGDVWREQVKLMIYRYTNKTVDDDTLNGYIDDYQSHLTISGISNVDSYMAHFANWMRCRLAAEINQPKQKNNGKENLAKLPDNFSIYG